MLTARDYVQHLFETHATDIENLTVWEMAEDFFGEHPSDEDFEEIFRLLDSATVEVEVHWDEQPSNRSTDRSGACVLPPCP